MTLLPSTSVSPSSFYLVNVATALSSTYADDVLVVVTYRHIDGELRITVEKFACKATLADIAHKNGLSPVEAETAEGPLLLQYNNATAWIKQYLAVEYVMHGFDPRQEIWELPLDAIKEAHYIGLD